MIGSLLKLVEMYSKLVWYIFVLVHSIALSELTDKIYQKEKTDQSVASISISPLLLQKAIYHINIRQKPAYETQKPTHSVFNNKKFGYQKLNRSNLPYRIT